MSSIFVVVYPDVQYNINGPGRLYYRHWPTDQSGPLPTQPETNTHFIGRFTAPIFSRFRYGSEDAVSSTLPPQPSTEPHFVGRHRPVAHVVLRGLRENPAADYIVGAGPPETNVHFIGRFTAPKFAFFQGSVAADAPVAQKPETNTHFVGRCQPASFALLRGLRENPATDYVQPAGAPETNSHFIGRFTAPKFAFFQGSAAADAPVTQQPETNTHFVGRFVPVSYTLLRALRENPAVDYVLDPGAPEANPHFLGRYTPPRFNAIRLAPLGDFPIAVQSETNTHFIGRFNAPNLFLLRALRENPAADFIVGPGPAETNVHFIGRFQPVSMRHLTDLWQNPATDFAVAPPVVSVVAMVHGQLHHHPPAAPGQPTYRNGLL